MDIRNAIDHLISHGMSPASAAAKEGLLSRCIQSLNNRPPAAAFYIPGRIEFLGKHTDYCGGRSLMCAIDKGLILAATPRDDANIRIIETISGEEAIISQSAESPILPGHWSNYPATVIRRVTQNFPGPLRGIDIAIASDLPPAAGLSSSSALVIGIFLILSQFNHLTARPEYQSNIHTPEDLAGYLGTVENGQTFGTLSGDRGVGTFGGSQDHTAILCCQPNSLSQYRFAPVVAERVIPFPKDYVLAVGVSGVVAEKTGAARDLYNQISLRAAEILRRWNEATGRHDPTLTAAMAVPQSTETICNLIAGDRNLTDRFTQFYRESKAIVPNAGSALLDGRFDDLAGLVDDSQAGAESLLHNQVPETIFLAACARKIGAIAASAFGAGFGGSVWAMIPTASADKFLTDWQNHYTRQFSSRTATAKFFLTHPCFAAMSII